MNYVRLGKTGLKVSRLCMGCMSFGTPGGATHPWVLPEDEAQPFFRKAVESGINFFDTANHYNFGDSEKITGKALKSFAKRDEIVVATKVGLRMNDDARPNTSGMSRKHVFDQIDQSLTRLGMDYVDILYVHRLDPGTEFDEMLDALEAVIQAGKVRYVAASSMWAWQFAKLREMQKARGYQQFVAMQNFYNLAYREEEREMMPYCVSEGVGVVPWSPIGRGFLAGNRPKDGQATRRAETDDRHHSYFGSEQDYAVLARVEEVAARLGVKPAQVAYAWVLSKSYVTAPIVGTTKLGQLEEAIGALDIKLDTEAVALLESAYRPRAVTGHN
ncbi:MAG: aldo/keto reductase [Hoeflea sp.]|uniref:aldo/keto reductase n=1 Tax=Hoeflea sp. TaxID=1940281 RepID=UPI001D99A458|nr:aldo/keto reductase [Hoeflea sp.]MBU4529979.1 aldo/keto reductase [Alphaproteobacteria bacterium]MBU4543206.1 aldo/keto reductase [Alphaproteobacteria bacterium]MBU4550254.1 aldo/keto reductase [Alphaproteobacteria bacterium]MBV1722472.1 aldo/keto reductase [Hoeflea sp.]MBV1761622.1 aldo/keto reductase [Hoeflea sp.]